MNNFQNDAATLFHDFVRKERSTFFGNDDKQKWLPELQPNDDDVRSMCPPFMGKGYQKGGLVIIPIQPGGGTGDKYFSDADGHLYEAIRQFKRLDADADIFEYYWNEFIPRFKKATKGDAYNKSYPIFKKMTHVLQASNTSLDNICYFNFIPYRCKDNKHPKNIQIIRNCINAFVKPALEFLQPSLVVAFGKQVANKYIENYWEDFNYEMACWNQIQAPRNPQHKKEIEQEREDCLHKSAAWAKKQPSGRR